MLSYRPVSNVVAALAAYIVRCDPAALPTAYVPVGALAPNLDNPRNASGDESTMDADSAAKLLAAGWSAAREHWIAVEGAQDAQRIKVPAAELRAAATDNAAAFPTWQDCNLDATAVVYGKAVALSGHRRRAGILAMQDDARKAAFGTTDTRLILVPVGAVHADLTPRQRVRLLCSDNSRMRGQRAYSASERLRACLVARAAGVTLAEMGADGYYVANNDGAPLSAADLLGSKRSVVADLDSGRIRATDLREVWKESAKGSDSDAAFKTYDDKRKAREVSPAKVNDKLSPEAMKRHVGDLRRAVGLPLFDDCLVAIYSGKVADAAKAREAAASLNALLVGHGIIKPIAIPNAQADRPAENVSKAISEAPTVNPPAVPAKRAAGAHRK